MFEIFRAISVSRRLDDRKRQALSRKDHVSYTQESVDAALSDTHNQPWAPSPSDLRQRVLERIELDRSMSMRRTQSRWMIPGIDGLPAVLRPLWALRAGGLIAVCAAASFLVPSIREAVMDKSGAEIDAIAMNRDSGDAQSGSSLGMTTSPDVYEEDESYSLSLASQQTSGDGNAFASRGVVSHLESTAHEVVAGGTVAQQSSMVPTVVFGMNDWMQFMNPKGGGTVAARSFTQSPVLPVRAAMNEPLLREAAALRADTSRFTRMILGPLAIPEN